MTESDQKVFYVTAHEKLGVWKREHDVSTMATTATSSNIKSYCVVKNLVQVLFHSLKLLLNTVNSSLHF